MINQISIKDFAIIQDTCVDFQQGLNIITGETGAGKSIVVEGISLALGARADSSYIRTGCDKAVVQLAGELDGEELVIIRQVSSNGKNICKLNGELVTLSQLNQVCEKLADIHGQYDNQSLLDPANHISFLDSYRRDELEPLKSHVEKAYHEYADSKAKLESLLKAEKDSRQKLDFYRYQMNEIETLNLTVGEDDELEEKITVLENAEKIYSNLEKVYENVYGTNSGVMSSLHNSLHCLEEICEYSKDIDEMKNVFSDAYYNIEDLNTTLRSLKDSISFSPEELDRSIARLEQINEAKLKYGKTIQDILAYKDKINEFLGNIIDFDHNKQALTSDVQEKLRTLEVECNSLSTKRYELAQALKEKIGFELSELNFSNSKIDIEFTRLQSPSPTGIDQVEFLISTNKGEPLKPLSKIASGGEMSRIMLAFKNIISNYDRIPTLIFDEIDNGISGITASIVGKKLRQISENHQIICITHLPQIAACGDTNYRIIKEESESSVNTAIQELNGDEIFHEIARLLGGTNVTENTLTSAKELILASKQ